MTAAHFAAALAIKSRVPDAPTGALIAGAFVPDFVWIALATAGIEPTKRSVFFDEWSHSLLSVLIFATLYALAFRGRGRSVAAAMWVAVCSHFVLDLPIHPKNLAVYPHSATHVGLGLSSVAPMTYWFVQLAVVLLLLGVYIYGTRRLGIASRWITATPPLEGYAVRHPPGL